MAETTTTISPTETDPAPAASSADVSTDKATVAVAEPSTTQPIVEPAPEPIATLTAPAEPGENPAITASASAESATPAAPPVQETIQTNNTASTEPTPDSTAVDSSNAAEAQEDKQAPEPQNALTEQFTESEWAALKEFREELPQIFADGFPDDSEAKDKSIYFWGVTIDPKNPLDARVSVILMKFLRARNLNVRDARDMLVSTLRWRTSINIDAVLKEEFPQDVFGNVGHIYGRDKEGRPVVYNIYGGNNLAEVFSDTKRFIRWRVALQEKSVAMLDFTEIDQTVQIHDYLGVSLTSRDAKSKAAASEATNIFQSHYPELLASIVLILSLRAILTTRTHVQHKKFFVNVPTLMNWIFWAFKPLLPAATLAKMSVVGTGHHALKKALSPVIPVKELPERYGGEAQGW